MQIDLVNENELGSIKRVIRGINSMAKVQQAVKGKVDLDYVLGVGGFDLERCVLWQTTGFLFRRGKMSLLISLHQGINSMSKAQQVAKGTVVLEHGLGMRGLT
jgi:G3E family GTPase